LEPTLAVLAAALVMIAVEQMHPGRRWPMVQGWVPRALLLSVAQAAAVFVTGLTWDRWFPQSRIWDASGLGVVTGAAIGYLAITFVYYWWHRARHEIPVIWRWLHQVHHSPQRIEVITSFYKHPLEQIANGALSSCVLFGLVGLDPAAAALAVTFTGLAELFYHWNVRTPYWLGFLIQRPESHCLHHRTGSHRSNYADLPLWDMLFGTFENPRHLEATCGFGPEREARLGAMLLGRDLYPQGAGHDVA
jgi:sterol desaturase/sphingolipid hydroxylase (fatty acid hydroxylase superfamily)